MRFAALKIGAGVPSEPFAGVVRSVFLNAAILSIADRPVTLAAAAIGGLPGAITLDVDQNFKFSDCLEVGVPAAARGGVLRIAHASTSIDLRGALHWRSGLRERCVDLANPSTERAWQTVAQAVRADGRSAAIVGLGRAAIVLLCGAARRFDFARAQEAAARLVGLGAGGTPAGDDVLVGFLTGLWTSLSGDRSRLEFAAGIACGLRGLTIRTNDVSRVYLEAAADGEVSERLSGLVGSLAAGGPPASLAASAAAAISVGHTSGADGVLGLLLGLAAWGPEPAFRESLRLVEETPRAANDV